MSKSPLSFLSHFKWSGLLEAMEKKPTSPSLEKILISYSEYNRLKSLEEKYQNLEKEKEKEFDNHRSSKLMHSG